MLKRSRMDTKAAMLSRRLQRKGLSGIIGRPVILLFFIVFSGFIVVIYKTDNKTLQTVAHTMMDITAPAIEIVSAPIGWVKSVIEFLRSHQSLREEIATLKSENEKLIQWEHLAKIRTKENEELRSILHVVPDEHKDLITVRVVGRPSNVFSQTILISGSRQDHLSKNQPVITPHGVVGRITEVGKFTSRVLPLTNINSRIPVKQEGTGDQALIAGTNSFELQVIHVEPNAKMKVGDKLFTSGHGGIFPGDLPVAIITHVDGKDIRALPICRHYDHNFMMVIQPATPPDFVKEDGKTEKNG